MVTHDIQESMLIVDYIYFMSEGRVVAEGTPDELRATKDPFVHQFLYAEADGPVPFHYPPAIFLPTCCGQCPWIACGIFLSASVSRPTDRIWRLGLPPAFRRHPRLFGADLPAAAAFAAGNLVLRGSLADHHPRLRPLRRPRAWPAGLRNAAALRLIRGAGHSRRACRWCASWGQLWPVSSLPRAGSAVTAEIGLMKATEAAEGDGHDGRQSAGPRRRSAFLGRRHLDAAAGGPLLDMGVFGGYLIGVVFIGVDEGAFWSQMQASVDFREDVLNGVIKSFVFGVAVSLIAVFEGYDSCLRQKASPARSPVPLLPRRWQSWRLTSFDLIHVPEPLMNRTVLDLWVGFSLPSAWPHYVVSCTERWGIFPRATFRKPMYCKRNLITLAA